MVSVDALIKDILSKPSILAQKSLCKHEVERWSSGMLGFLFPILQAHNPLSPKSLKEDYERLEEKLAHLLECVSLDSTAKRLSPNDMLEQFFGQLPSLRQKLLADAEFIAQEDPAAHSLTEVVLCYPGFRAIAVHRLAHEFYREGWVILARVLSEYAHHQTGVDIHPGAQIQTPFFIDHGTGIVVGETAEIGQRVKLFQGVTLGAKSVKGSMAKKKRHPSVQDNCVIYANAAILGGDVVIGHDSVVGGNVWLTQSVPPHSRVFRENRPEDLVIEPRSV